MTITHLQPMVRLVLSAGIIFGVLAAVAATSSALFTTAPAVADNNTFATGSADLLIASDDGTFNYAASIPGANVTGLTPGETVTFNFWLKNDSDDTLELDLTTDLEAISDLTGTDFGPNLSVQFICNVQNTGNRDGATPLKTLDTWSTDPATTLDDGHHELAGTLGANSGPGTGVGVDEALCTMSATLAEASTSDNSAVSFDATFLGTQISGT